MHIVGIDLGGTKIEGVVLDPAQPTNPVCRLRRLTEPEQGYEHILSQIEAVVEDLKRECSSEFPVCVGIGTPGTLDPKTQTLRGSNTQCLNGRPLKSDLEKLLGLKLEMANDANCFALAEATLGAGRGYETVFGIIMGTGCGGGYVVNGCVLSGCHGIAGEWGQVVIEPDGELSGYGTRGIVEAYISGPALEKFYESESGVKLPLSQIMTAPAGDAAAAATLERLEDFFPRALATIIDTFDPHAIVIGGGVGNIDLLYTPEMRARISSLIFAPSFEAALLRPKLGDSAGVFGAAMLTA